MYIGEILGRILVYASLVLLLVGFIKPGVSLFWYKKERTRRASAVFYCIALFFSFAFFMIFAIISDPPKTSNKVISDSSDSASTANNRIILTENQKDSIQQIKIRDRIKNTFTAEKLMSYYTDNEVNADGKFKSKNFYVIGNIHEISKSKDDQVYITLETDVIFQNIKCFIHNEDVSKLHSGQKVTIYGTGYRFDFDVIMVNCYVVDN